MFYSFLYLTLQSPYVISEEDSAFRGTNGNKSRKLRCIMVGRYGTIPAHSCHCWPLHYPKNKGMIKSISNLFVSGKKDFARQTEPTNIIRTEHVIVVLLDAYR